MGAQRQFTISHSAGCAQHACRYAAGDISIVLHFQRRAAHLQRVAGGASDIAADLFRGRRLLAHHHRNFGCHAADLADGGVDAAKRFDCFGGADLDSADAGGQSRPDPAGPGR